MKHLYLLRHAKSSWENEALQDYDRPLAPRGLRAGSVMCQYMIEQNIRPDLVLCSSAKRTRETFDTIAPALDGVPVIFEKRIYEATSSQLLDRLRELSDEIGGVMLIGHNPGIQNLALLLADAPEDAEKAARADTRLERVRAKFPTAALACMTFDGKWPDLVPGAGALTGYVRPKQLQSEDA